MPWSLSFSRKPNLNPTTEEHNSILASLKRIYIYWQQIIFRRIRLIFTIVFVKMIELATRLTCFPRQRTIVRTASPLLMPSFEQDDITCCSTSLINCNTNIDLPLIEPTSMAHMLIQQQTTTLPLHQTSSTTNESILPLTHSLDEIFYKPGSTSLIQFLQKYASTSNGFRSKTSTNSELVVDEKLSLNCDEIQSIIPETECLPINYVDSISSGSSTPVDLDQDTIVNDNSSSSLNISDRHFRRRKRRSSLTKSSTEQETIQLDSIEKVLQNPILPQVEISQAIQLENLSLNDKQQTTTPIRRRLRFRSSRSFNCSHAQTIISDKPVEFFISTESTTLPSSPISPLPSPTQTINGALKRTGSLNTTKKIVRFADSVGRELTQVQYIRSILDEDNEKNDILFIQKKLIDTEHKPWSFDFSPSIKQNFDRQPLRRFFCLFRQPNSEHPDIYLHEVWKSQIKLEHAEIRLKPNTNNEQYLHGTIWVTNADYNKNVTVKYSFNRWFNSYEYDAQYKCHSNDFRNLDQFEFNIDIPHDVDRIDFVLRYHVNWQEYWDNNEGKNYTIETDSASIPHTTISLPHDYDFNEMRFY